MPLTRALAGWQITAPNGVEVDFTNTSGAATVYPKQLRIHRAQLQYQDALVKASGRMLADESLGTGGRRGRGLAHASPAGVACQRQQFKGNFDELPMTVTIDRPFHAVVKGSALTLNSGWKFRGTGDIRDFDLQPFGGGNALGLISGRLEIQAEQSGFSAQGALDPKGLAAGPLDVDFAGAYAQQQLQIKHTVIVHPPSRTRLTMSGTVQVVEGGPALDLTGEWTDFRWPLAAAKPAFRSPRGNLRLQGIRPWKVRGPGRCAGGSGAVVPGQAHWRAGQRLPADTARGPGPAARHARTWPAKCAGVRARAGRSRAPRTMWTPRCCDRTCRAGCHSSFDASGAPFGGKAALDVAFSNLTGQLRGQKASGTGQVAARIRHRRLAVQGRQPAIRQDACGAQRQSRRCAGPGFRGGRRRPEHHRPRGARPDQCPREICRPLQGQRVIQLKAKGTGLRVARQRTGRAQCRRGHRTRQQRQDRLAVWNSRDCSTAGDCCKARDCNSMEPMPRSAWQCSLIADPAAPFHDRGGRPA